MAMERLKIMVTVKPMFPEDPLLGVPKVMWERNFIISLAEGDKFQIFVKNQTETMVLVVDELEI